MVSALPRAVIGLSKQLPIQFSSRAPLARRTFSAEAPKQQTQRDASIKDIALAGIRAGSMVFSGYFCISTLHSAIESPSIPKHVKHVVQVCGFFCGVLAHATLTPLGIASTLYHRYIDRP